LGIVDELRSVERAFLGTGDDWYLDRAAEMLEGDLREAPFAPATRVWLLLLRHDRSGDDRHLDAAVQECGPREWRDPDLALVAVPVLLRQWAREGDYADLDRAVALSCPSVAPIGRRLPLWQGRAWRAIDLAQVYLERHRLRGTEDDLGAAFDLLRGGLRAAREPSIRALGLRQLAACEHAAYLRHGTRRLLDRAIRRHERALAMITVSSVVRPMLLTELGRALQDRFAEDDDVVDINHAVALADEAATADAGRPDSACHLVNLGTALNTRYEHSGDPRDLDRALRCWAEALDALPPRSAYRPAFLDRLALGFDMRWEYEHGAVADLDAAIEHGQLAVREGAGTPDAAVYACHLAAPLMHRWEIRRDPDDLHEAVRIFVAAAESHERDGANSTDLAVNLAHILLGRYQALGGLADVDAALAVLGRLPVTGLGRSQRSTVSASVARALMFRYQATGVLDDLAAAITAARRGLTGVDRMSTMYNSRTARLARLLHLRYQRRGRSRDLEAAIRLLRAVVDSAPTGAGREPSAAELNLLATLFAERCAGNGDPADREAALRLSRQARESGHGETDPVLDAMVASMLHDRFTVEGSFEELDEAVDQYRASVEQQVPTAPLYPTLLNDLGITLQDSYIHRGQDAELDEAIDAHERAVACCPPGSPDRPGYLSVLAVALQLRYERDDRAADLGRVIDLYDEALAALPAEAPERAAILTGLAAARHHHARRTRAPADFDAAIGTFRAALRRSRRNRLAHAVVLHGYAEVLADRSVLAPADRDGADVLRTFRHALAASVGAPVVRLDVAGALAEWALRVGRWRQAAEASQAAAATRRSLFGRQLEPAHRNSWLVRGEDLSVAGAFARVRCAEPNFAATALEAGRALGLAEVLDARTLADRLLGSSHRDLADRYEQAMNRVARAATTRPRLGVRSPRPAPDRSLHLPDWRSM
jgi:hypothetical protein